MRLIEGVFAFFGNPVKSVTLVEGDFFESSLFNEFTEVIREGSTFEGCSLHSEVPIYHVGSESQSRVRKNSQHPILAVLFTHASAVCGHGRRSIESTSSVRSAFWHHSVHTFIVVGKLLSSWPQYTWISHELVVTLRLLAIKKRTAACPQQTPSSWPENRMQPYDLNRFKTTGTIAAQTPSSASAPDQLGTLVGAHARAVTATDQSTQTPGGGRCAGV